MLIAKKMFVLNPWIEKKKPSTPTRIRLLERFSIECRKTKTKADHNGQSQQMKISEGANENSK